jgi:hypothetical protein
MVQPEKAPTEAYQQPNTNSYPMTEGDLVAKSIGPKGEAMVARLESETQVWLKIPAQDDFTHISKDGFVYVLVSINALEPRS